MGGSAHPGPGSTSRSLGVALRMTVHGSACWDSACILAVLDGRLGWLTACDLLLFLVELWGGYSPSGLCQGRIPVPSAALPCLSPLLAYGWLSPFAVSLAPWGPAVSGPCRVHARVSQPWRSASRGGDAGRGAKRRDLQSMPLLSPRPPGQGSELCAESLSWRPGEIGLPGPSQLPAPPGRLLPALPLPHHPPACPASLLPGSHSETVLRPCSDLPSECSWWSFCTTGGARWFLAPLSPFLSRAGALNFQKRSVIAWS